MPASNMGTSVRVIESNYGDRDNVARGQKMGRKSWDTDSDNNDKDYPFLWLIISPPIDGKHNPKLQVEKE